MTTTWGAPAVTDKKGNGLKQLLPHGPTVQLRIGHRHGPLPSPPQAGAGLQPQAKVLPVPVSDPPLARWEQKGCRQGAASFLFVYPQTPVGIKRGNPSFIHARVWISRGRKQRWKRWTNTYICAAAASPGSPPTSELPREWACGRRTVCWYSKAVKATLAICRDAA